MTVGVRRGLRPLAAATLTAAVAMTGTVIGGAPALSPAFGATCDTPFPVADLAAHQPVHGLTVSAGTTPDPFTGEVLGVLANGIAPGVDMVMMRLTSPEIDRVGGIWAGMSGSPVYAEDGRLIGAVAYGMTWGSSPVAGVTPFEKMDDYLPVPAKRGGTVSVGLAAARAIAAGSDVTVAQAQQGFSRLPLAGGVSGLSQTQLDKLNKRQRGYLNKAEQAGVIGSAAAATAADIVNGGNVSFSATNGDINVAATGTVTSVCGSTIVGFGHPATYLGKIAAGLSPADVIYVQEDPAGTPFKVSNIAPPVGTITDDHLTGITGDVGTAPTGADVTSTATYGTRTRTGTTSVYMDQFMARGALYQLYYNQDAVLDHYGPGSEEASWTISGTVDGTPFTLDMGDRYRSTYDIALDAVWDVPDMLYELTGYPSVEITSVEHDATFVDSTDEWKVKGVQVKAAGAWVTLPKGATIMARAGSTLKLRALLQSTSGAAAKAALSVDIPANGAGRSGRINVVGGGDLYNRIYGSDSAAELIGLLQDWIRNDQVAADGYLGSGGATCLSDKGCKRASINLTGVSALQDMVVEGHKAFRIRVK